MRNQSFRPLIGAGVELDSCIALAFDLLLNPGEYFRIHRLRAGVSTPQAPANRSKEKQRIGRYDQQDGKEKHVLRPEDHPQDIKLALGQIEQHSLPSVPGQPTQAVIDELGNPDQRPAPGGEDAAYGPRVNLLVNFVKAFLDELGDTVLHQFRRG
ncbi:MAG: hypothetical protein V9E90_08725 [Saprospiraceae bacterium]